MAIFTTAAGIEDLTGKLSKEDRIVMRQKKYRLPAEGGFCAVQRVIRPLDCSSKRKVRSGYRQTVYRAVYQPHLQQFENRPLRLTIL